MARVASREPPSTTIASQATPWSSRLASAVPSVAAASSVGVMIDKAGAGCSLCGIAFDYRCSGGALPRVQSRVGFAMLARAAKRGSPEAEKAALRVIVLGGDGFCGWASALHLSARGHE